MGRTRKPFIDKSSARTFQLVHRARDDPKFYDDESSSMVFKETTHGREEDEEEDFSDEEVECPPGVPIDGATTAGSAALYGISFDDTQYDYTQHLRPVGEAAGAVLLEAPAPKPKATGGFQLTEDVLGRSPSPEFVVPMPRIVPTSLSSAFPGGLNPDMDPSLREVLEALDDDEAVSEGEGLDDDIIQVLNAEGDFSDEEGGWGDEGEEEEGEEGEEEDWEARFRRFKIEQAHKRAQQGSDDEGEEDEGFDRQTVGTGMSMSSSAMFRNDKLTLLDQQFERIEEEYEEDEDEDEEEMEEGVMRVETRQDFEAIMDEFLEKYEIIGKHMREILPGTAEEKLDTIRRSLGGAILPEEDGSRARRSGGDGEMPERSEEAPKATWDCQSIISTYSNLDNHPALIRERPSLRIRLGKGGLPRLMNLGEEDEEEAEKKKDEEKEEGEEGEEEEEERENKGKARSKKETPEEKRLRKAAVKEERRMRRTEKKENRLDAKESEQAAIREKIARAGAINLGSHVFSLQ